MVNTVKFSEFEAADINDSTTQDVGLSSGVNTREKKFYTWTTPGRPATPFNGLLGLNTTLQQYEFWDSVAMQWTQFADSNVFAVLASHAAGQGASLIGLQDQSNVTSKFVQDLANATFIAQTDNGSLQNAQFLGSLTTGIVKNTTVTGVLSISAPLTSIDSLTTALGDILYVSAPDTYVNLAGNTTTTKQFLSQTGTGVISAAPAWSTISAGDIVSPAALTKTDDTNVTLSLGGSPTVALLAATSLTLGWTGTLSPTRGGLGLSDPTAHGILVGEGSSAVNPIVLSSGQLLIGSTGVDPVAGAIGSGTGILVGNGAGSITVSLAAIADHTLLANISGGVAAPTSTTLTALIDNAIGSTQGDILYRNATSWVVLAPGTSGQFLQTQGAAANPQWVTSATVTPAALTKTDDTNVTLSLGGSPTVALLAATSLTLGWTGQLAGSRGGTGVNNGASTATYAGNLNFAAAFSTSGAFAVTQTYTGVTNVTFPTSGTLATTSQLPTPSALTKVDDTNVTLTLGGSPTVALLAATSLTLGWTGQLGLTRGGTNASLTAANGGILYSTASALAISAAGSSGQLLQSAGATTPVWTTATYPATTTINQLLYSSSANTVVGLATANSAVLITSAGGVPSLSTTLPSGIAASGMLLTSPRITTGLLDTNGANWIAQIATASAVNYITVANQSTTNSPSIGATGSDSNIALVLNGKGTLGAQIQGRTNGSSPDTGYAGEELESVVSSGAPVALTNNTNANVTSLSLSAGNWMVFGNISYVNPTGTNSFAIGWISTTSATGVDASLFVQTTSILTNGNDGFTVPTRYFKSSSSFTAYLSTISGFTGNLSACGGLYAIRMP